MIYLREDQFSKLVSVAEKRGTSMAALCRDAVDLLLTQLDPNRSDSSSLDSLRALGASPKKNLGSEEHDLYLYGEKSE